MTWQVVALKRALRPGGRSSGLIKGEVADEPNGSLYPGFSASGQDVWLDKPQFSGAGIVLSAVGARCGKAFEARGEWGTVANTVALIPQPGYDVHFLWYLVNDEEFWEKGGAAQPYVRVAETLDRRLLIPSLPVQRAIADYLDAETARIDALIEKKRRMVVLLEERYAADRATKVLGTFDPVTATGIHPEGWCEVLLGVLVELQRGHDLPTDDRRGGDVPVVSSGGVSGWHDIAAARGPGVVTGRYGTIGEVYYVEGDYWPLNTTLYVKDFRGNEPRWVFHALAALPLDIDAAKSAVTGINRNVVGNLRVPVPRSEVQREVARHLDDAARIITQTSGQLVSQIDLLTERRRALITAAVTGQLDIPGVAA